MRDFKLRRRFNKLVKDGGTGGGGVLRIGFDGTTLDKTWREISDCFAKGGYAYIAGNVAPNATSFATIVGVYSQGSTYSLAANAGGESGEFNCGSPDEYPTNGK